MRVAAAALLGALLASPVGLAAQTRTVAGDTATQGEALVLGGGGARGLAHAGVILGLEQRGRDPDLVVGTSMGAIIGALYAAGYPPEQVIRIIGRVNWPALFTAPAAALVPDEAPRRPMLRVGLPSADLRPQGLVSEAAINRTLVRLLFDAEARSRGDFDRLARRFRAVAADLRTGDAVVLGSGDLARAVRASMAIPGVFPPVVLDGRVLVDGGIRDNLAVGVARGLGARRVIASDVLGTDSHVEARSAYRVGVRALRLLLHNAGERDRPDLRIVPVLPESWPALLFPRDAGFLIDAGLSAALAATTPERPPPSPPLLPPPPAVLGRPRIRAPDPALRRLAGDAMAAAAPGPYRPRRVLAGVDRLYATGLLDGVWPSVDSAGELVVLVEPSPARELIGAAGWENDRGWRAWGAVAGRGRLGYWPLRLSLAVSDDGLVREAVAAGRLWPAAPPGAVTFGGVLRHSRIRDFRDGDLVGDSTVRRVAGWIGVETARMDPAWTASLRIEVDHAPTDTGGTSVFGVAPYVRIEAPPTAGAPVGEPLLLVAGFHAGAAAYSVLGARVAARARFRGLYGALVAEVRAVGAAAPTDLRPALGDARRLPGLRWGERRDAALAVFGADIAASVPLGGFARIRIRTGQVGPSLDALGPLNGWLVGAEAGLLWPTPFGQIETDYGRSSGGEGRFRVGIGGTF